jgi:hypothetical protein
MPQEQPERIPYGLALVLAAAIAVLAGVHAAIPPVLTYSLVVSLGAGAGVSSPRKGGVP